MKVHLIGSGGALTNARRSNTSLVIEADTSILIDCSGTPPTALDKIELNWTESLNNLVLTHHHPDHIYGFLSLAHQRYIHSVASGSVPADPMCIHGPERALNKIRDLLQIAELHGRSDMFELRYRPLSGKETTSIGSIEVTTLPVSHGHVPTFGLHINTKGAPDKGIVFSSDTEPCETLIQQSQNAKILFHECSTVTEDTLKGHTSLTQIEDLASRVGAEKIVLVHLPPMSQQQEKALEIRLESHFKGRVTLGQDMTSYTL